MDQREQKLEPRDWTAFGKDSFTTPGAAAPYPAAPGSRVYAYDAQPAAAGQAARPASPFSREAASGLPWDLDPPTEYAPPQELAAPDSPAEAAAQAAVTIPSAAAQAAAAIPSAAAGGAQVYTIQLPPRPAAPAPKRRSLWWLLPALLGALLLGVLLGVLCYPIFSEPGAGPQPAPQSSGEAVGARIYRQNVDAVVGITAIPVEDPAGAAQSPSGGTGFLISEDGYLLTSAHVVMGAGEIRVYLNDGRQFQAALVGLDRQKSDVALLKIEATGLHPVTLGDAGSLQVGDWLCTIGNPLGELSFSLTTGTLSAAPRQIKTGGATLTMLQTNAAINRGNSGGPLFDAEGRVVGVVTAKYAGAEGGESAEGLGFALPINDVMKLAELWMRG